MAHFIYLIFNANFPYVILQKKRKCISFHAHSIILMISMQRACIIEKNIVYSAIQKFNIKRGLKNCLANNNLFLFQPLKLLILRRLTEFN